MAPSFRNVFTRAYLQAEYIDKKRPSTSIAKEHGCSFQTVLRWLRLNDVIRRTKKDIRRDMTGETYGNWRVIEPLPTKPNAKDGSKRLWACECCCGTIKHMAISRMMNTKSCGCKSYGVNSVLFRGSTHVSAKYWGQVLRSANERGREVTITLDYADKVLQKQGFKCALTGWDIMPHQSDKVQWNASLDRIDSELGYIKGNVQWIHKDVNRIKWHLDESYFQQICSAVHKHSKRKK